MLQVSMYQCHFQQFSSSLSSWVHLWKDSLRASWLCLFFQVFQGPPSWRSSPPPSQGSRVFKPWLIFGNWASDLAFYWGIHHQPPHFYPFLISSDGISCMVTLLICILPLSMWCSINHLCSFLWSAFLSCHSEFFTGCDHCIPWLLRSKCYGLTTLVPGSHYACFYQWAQLCKNLSYCLQKRAPIGLPGDVVLVAPRMGFSECSCETQRYGQFSGFI